MTFIQIAPGTKCDIFFSEPNLTVDFTAPNSMREVLGFNARVLGPGYNVSDNIISINNTNTIFVHYDLMKDLFVNAKIFDSYLQFLSRCCTRI